MKIDALELAKQLLAIPSVSPQDLGCQEILKQHLNNMGFNCETLLLGPAEQQVTNLWAFKAGSSKQAKTFLYAGHTDVVPSGPVQKWTSPPFTPTIRDGKLFARGTSDMKTASAIFLAALQQFLTENPQHSNNIALLITSDEEGDATYGTKAVCQILQQRNISADWCIIGEASSTKQTGDMIKNGRRGSLSALLTINGVQGHIAYPHLADNPIHKALAALDELTKTEWDQGNEYFEPTSMQFSNLNSGTGAYNVIPADIKAAFNFRFSPERTPQSLQQQVEQILTKYKLDFKIDWLLGGNPFLTSKGLLTDVVSQAIKEETGLTTELSTSGGTSDGRFIIDICPEVVEIGPPNNSIHKINEYIELSDITKLQQIYWRIITQLVR